MGSFWSEEIEEEESDTAEELDEYNQANWDLESAQRLKHPEVSILKEILRRIKLKKEEMKRNNEYLREFLDSFIDKLKEVDDLFKLIFEKLAYEGSFYANLRVCTPNEFDINVVLKPPFSDSEFEVIHQPQAPSYVKISMKDHSTALEKYPKLAKTLFDDDYLIPEKVRKWIQSVVDKALNPPKSCMQVFKNVRTKQAGPARTIILTMPDGTKIDIDIVPVVKCTLELPKSSLNGNVKRRVGNTLKAYLVPKPYSSFGKQMPINEKEASHLWRSHFSEAEKIIIHNLGCVKPIIKLLKFLRDKEDWKILASYYLKTLVMWMVIENNDKEYWNEGRMDKRFIEALQKLEEAVSQKKIPYLFNEKYNLLEKLNDDQARNLSNRLVYLIKKIKEDGNFLWNIFQETSSF